jgi:hypothetical protein
MTTSTNKSLLPCIRKVSEPQVASTQLRHVCPTWHAACMQLPYIIAKLATQEKPGQPNQTLHPRSATLATAFHVHGAMYAQTSHLPDIYRAHPSQLMLKTLCHDCATGRKLTFKHHSVHCQKATSPVLSAVTSCEQLLLHPAATTASL